MGIMAMMLFFCPYITLVLSEEKLPVFDQDVRRQFAHLTLAHSGDWKRVLVIIWMCMFKFRCVGNMIIILLKCCHPTKVQSFITALWNTNANEMPLQYFFVFRSLRCHASIFKPNISPVSCLIPPASTLMPCPETWVPPLKITDSCDYI